MPETESVVETQPFHAKNLLSTHFLNVHLKTMDEWLETKEAEKAFRCIRSVYEKHKDELPTCNESQLEDKLIKPVLKCLDHHFEVQALALSGRPDYAFFADKESAKEAVKRQKQDDFYLKTIAVGDAKVWEEPLDRFRGGRPVYERSNPSYQIDTYLRATPPRWAILTNGRYWRLYCEDTSYRGDSYYEVDLVKLIEGENLDDFKYFYLFFRRQAFARDGEVFLDKIYSESADYARALGESLKENVYQAMRIISEGFLEWPENNLSTGPAHIGLIRENSMKLLYRLLFVLYAESRGLLDLSNKEYAKMSLKTLKREISQRIDGREAISKLRNAYWSRLEDLFRLINQGSEALGFSPDILYVPPYNGDLFDPDRNAFLRNKRVSDFYLAPSIDLLARSVERKGSRAMIDYSTLDIRHLGSIYEGLLEFKLEPAEEDMVAVKVKGREKWTKKSEARGKVIDKVKAGELYLRTDKMERKVTGSYYTPEYIVKYIVDNALSPIVREKLKQEKGLKSEAILSIKVLDPAMGSGHFLVEAVDFLAKHLVEAVKRDGEENQLPERDYSADWAKREIASHCIYGVDKNPMAVELAKVSLWLKTISKDRPLSFLDHRLKCGNSLIGARLEDLPHYPQPRRKKDVDDRTERFDVEVRRPFVDELLKKVGELESAREETVEDIKHKEDLFEELRSSREYKRIKSFADVYTAIHFGNPTGKDYYYDLLWALRGSEIEWSEKTSRLWFGKAENIALVNRFFHWQLEFPEVFYGPERKTSPGFDAVIGNPPYLQKESFNKDEKKFILTYFPENSSNVNLATIFMSQSRWLTRKESFQSFIVPKSLLFTKAWEGDRGRLLPGLRRLCDVSKAWKEVLLEQCIYVWQNRHVATKRFFIDKCEAERIVPGDEMEKNLCERLGTIPSEFSPEISNILDRCFAFSESLAEHADLPCGLPYQSKLREEGDFPAMGGKQIWRFLNLGIKGYFVEDDLRNDMDFVNRVKSPHIVLQRLVAHVLQPTDHIIVAGTVDQGQNVPVNTITCLFPKEGSELSLHFLCAWINSLFYSWYAYNFVFSKAIRSMDLYEYYAVRVPMRRISFKTEADERSTLAKDAEHLYQEYLVTGDHQPILDFTDSLLPVNDKGCILIEKEKSDVVHDILGYLAEQLIAMKKSRYEEIESFLEWLEGEIRSEIDGLANKMKLREYYYLDFNQFKDVLRQNRRKLPINPTNREFLKDAKREFEKSVAKLLPLGSRIRATDMLIDQIVYKLYGLREDEIELIGKSVPIHDTKEAQGSKTIEEDPNLVWYACYGSNLLRSRFMHYIEGGSPEGISRAYEGCSNKDPPRGDKQIEIPHELYFSKKSRTWENKAVAFVKSEKNRSSGTLGRMYLITREQFQEVARQENGLSPDCTSFEIDFEKVISKEDVIVSDEWYGRVIQLGYEDGYPIFTITGSWEDDAIDPAMPGDNYLRFVANGIREEYGKSENELVEYLKRLDGIVGRIDEDALRKTIGLSES